MAKFIANKIGRDKSLEGLTKDGMTAQYHFVSGHELRQALQRKLVEEAQEVHESKDHKEIIDELGDVLEVIDGLCKAYDISMADVLKAKAEKRERRGGFETGFYVDIFEVDENNPKINYFRASPHKYPEIK